MNNCIPRQHEFVNEPILRYRPDSPERLELEQELARMSDSFVEIPLIIGGQEIRTGNMGKCVVPHDHQRVIGEYHRAG